MRKILVIQTAFIGDVVLATALVEKLHQFYPEAAIDFLVRKGNEGLLQEHPFLRRIIIWNKQQQKFRHLWKLIGEIRREKYDAVINVQRFAATGILTALSGAPVRIGFNKNPLHFFFTRSVPHIISTADHPLHEVDRNQELIRTMTDTIPSRPRLYPSATDDAAVKALKGQPYIVVAPASVWFTKQFPVEKWIELINKVPDHIKVYITGGPGDKALADRILQGVTRKGVENICGMHSMLRSVSLQRDALMNYVNDSAPMHFASSVNAPVTAIYCSTLPSFGFGPLSEKSTIIETTEALDCRPCGLHGQASCPKGHFRCAFSINTDRLLDALK